MKIRTGFVSNSSSSSFVVLLPENFIETIDFDKVTDGDEDFPLDEFKRMLNDLIKVGDIWVDGIYDEYETDDRDFYDILDNLLEPYVIASMETSSDAGQIVVADRDAVKKILR